MTVIVITATYRISRIDQGTAYGDLVESDSDWWPPVLAMADQDYAIGAMVKIRIEDANRPKPRPGDI